MRAVLLSGPPNSGKDSIANMLRAMIQAINPEYLVAIEHPAKTIRQCGMLLLNENDSNVRYEKLKDQAIPLFQRKDGGCDNFRQFMIALMENYLRPRYGADFLARIVKAQYATIWDQDAILILPSIGFQVEADFFLNDLGSANVVAVQVQRNGCSFESKNDSRSYVSADHNLAVENNGTISWAAQTIVAKMVNLGWDIRP